MLPKTNRLSGTQKPVLGSIYECCIYKMREVVFLVSETASSNLKKEYNLVLFKNAS